MSKRSPFDYVKSINEKKPVDELTGYNPFLTNRAFSMHQDTIMLADMMNTGHKLPPELQYDFYYHSVRKGRRFGFPSKPHESDNLTLVMEHYNYSKEKALEAMRLLSDNDIMAIRASKNKGGM
jgi:hypothetical protein